MKATVSVSGVSSVYPALYGAGSYRALPGQLVTVAFDVWAPTVPSVGVQLAMYDADGLNAKYGPIIETPTGPGWVRATASFVIPEGIYFFRPLLARATREIGDVFYIDGVTIEAGETDGSYFDGDTPSTADHWHTWTGTPHASTSTRNTWADITADITTGWQTRITVSTIEPGAQTMSITRLHPDGTEHPVMAATNIPATPGTWDDPEAPLNTPVRYRVTFAPGHRATSTPITITPPGGLPILSDPYRGLAVPIRLTKLDERTHASRTTVVDIEGRPDPITIWDIEPAPRHPTIEWLTHTPADAVMVDELAAPGHPILLRTPCPSIQDTWIQRLGQRTDAAFRRNSPTRVHTWSDCLTSTTTWQPDIKPGGDTLEDLDTAVGHTTLGDIAARWTTLLDIAATDLKDLA